MPNRQSPYGDHTTVHSTSGRAKRADRDPYDLIMRTAVIIFASFHTGVGTTLL